MNRFMKKLTRAQEDYSSKIQALIIRPTAPMETIIVKMILMEINPIILEKFVKSYVPSRIVIFVLLTANALIAILAIAYLNRILHVFLYPLKY